MAALPWPVLALTALGILLRIGVTLMWSGLAHPDEVYQSLEVAHVLAFGGIGRLPPEYQQPEPMMMVAANGSHVGPIDSLGASRSPIIPYLLAATFTAADMLGLDYWRISLPFVRCLLACVAGLLPIAALPVVQRGTSHSATILLVVGMLACDEYFVYWAAHGVIQAVLTPALLWLSWRCWTMWSPGCWFFLTVVLYIRPDMALGWLVIAMLCRPCLPDRRQLLASVSCICSATAACVVIDYVYYGMCVVSPWNWFRFNVIEGLSGLSGEQPASLFAKLLLLDNPLNLACLCMLGVCVCLNVMFNVRSLVSQPVWPLCGAICLLTLPYLLAPHKEERFVFMACAFFSILYGYAVEYAIRIVQLVPTVRLLSLAQRLVWWGLAVWLVSGWWRATSRTWTSGHHLHAAMAWTGQQWQNGTIAVAVPWTQFGQGTYIHTTNAVEPMPADMTSNPTRYFQAILTNPDVQWLIVRHRTVNKELALAGRRHGLHSLVSFGTGAEQVDVWKRQLAVDRSVPADPVTNGTHTLVQSSLELLWGYGCGTVTGISPFSPRGCSRQWWDAHQSCLDLLVRHSVRKGFVLHETQLQTLRHCVTFTSMMLGHPTTALDFLSIQTESGDGIACDCHQAYHSSNQTAAWFYCSLLMLTGSESFVPHAYFMLSLLDWQVDTSKWQRLWNTAVWELLSLTLHAQHPAACRIALMSSVLPYNRGYFGDVVNTLQTAPGCECQVRLAQLLAAVGLADVDWAERLPTCFDGSYASAWSMLSLQQALGQDVHQWRDAAVAAKRTHLRWLTTEEFKSFNNPYCLVEDPDLVGLTAAFPPTPAPAGSVHIVSFATQDAEHQAQADIWLQSFQAYAQQHGYSLALEDIQLHPTDRPAAWTKLSVMQQHLCRAEWLVWVDIDIIIADASIALEGFLQVSPDVHVVVQADPHMVMNTGVMAVRCSPWAMDWLAYIDSLDEFTHHPMWENAAMVHAYRTVPEVMHATRILPYETWQVLPPHFQLGHFMIHFAGGKHRATLMKRWAAQIVLRQPLISATHEEVQDILVAGRRDGQDSPLEFGVPVAMSLPPPPNDVCVVIPTMAPFTGLATAVHSVVDAFMSIPEPVAFHIVVSCDDCQGQDPLGSLLPNVTVIHHQSRSAGASRNAAIRSCGQSSDLIMFCDDDDEWFSNHVARVLEQFQHDASIAFVKTGVSVEGANIHEYWQEAIENSLVINLAVRPVALEFVQTFWELPGAGGEDVALNSALQTVFVGSQVHEQTVRYRRKDAGTLQAQMRKFQMDPAAGAQDAADDYNPMFHAALASQKQYLISKLRWWQPPAHTVGLFVQAYEAYVPTQE